MAAHADMVCDFGMSESLGPLSYGKREEQIFLGREIAQHRTAASSRPRRIDDEVRGIVSRAYRKDHRPLIRDNMDTLHRMAQALLEKETLNAKDMISWAGDGFTFTREEQQKADTEGVGRTGVHTQMGGSPPGP